jgi:hypothetical protein
LSGFCPRLRAILSGVTAMFVDEQHYQMYSDVVHRTQIYLTDEESDLLDRAERSTGASRSELIRRAIRLAFGDPERTDRLAALRASAGIWRDRGFTAPEYLDAIRGRDPQAVRRVLGDEG